MDLIVKEFTQSDAIEICTWKYEYPYDVYNYPLWEVVKNHKWAMAEPEKRSIEFRSVYSENELLGYFRLVDLKGYYMLGLGLKPEYCGKGYGSKLMKLILRYLSSKKERYCIHLEVREFNKRAIKCYEKAGFVQKDKYIKETLMGKDTFILMEINHS